jgi:single-strand DNA-binding protein
MLKFQGIGYAGKDAVVQVHGTDGVINFAICHTDKYTDAAGQKYEKATWVQCSWWRDNTNIAQYIKKGTLLFVEGIPEAKQWKNKQTGETNAYLSVRVIKVELLGGKREDNSDQNNQYGASADFKMDNAAGDDDLPF